MTLAAHQALRLRNNDHQEMDILRLAAETAGFAAQAPTMMLSSLSQPSQDSFLDALPDQAPSQLQPQQLRVQLFPLQSCLPPTLSAASASMSSVQPTTLTTMVEKQLSTPLQEQTMVTTQDAKAKAPKRVKTSRKRKQVEQPSESADDQARSNQVAVPRLQLSPTPSLVSMPQPPQLVRESSSSPMRMQITAALVAKAGNNVARQVSLPAATTVAPAATKSILPRTTETTHINNVEMLAAQVFDEVIVPAIEAREWCRVRLKIGIMKRLAMQSIKTELVTHADLQSSSVSLARVSDVLLSCLEHY